MRFIRCGSKLFDPKAVTAVHLFHENDTAVVVVPGDFLFFRGPDAEAVRKFFLSMPASDLMHRYEAEAPEAVADNHTRGEC